MPRPGWTPSEEAIAKRLRQAEKVLLLGERYGKTHAINAGKLPLDKPVEPDVGCSNHPV